MLRWGIVSKFFQESRFNFDKYGKRALHSVSANEFPCSIAVLMEGHERRTSNWFMPEIPEDKVRVRPSMKRTK